MNDNHSRRIQDIDSIEDRGFLITEKSNKSSRNLDELSTSQLVELFTTEDLKPQQAVKLSSPELVIAIDNISEKLQLGGRIFYLGAGTSGRLGILDATECPPTFCTPPELVTGIIAGGINSLIKSSEGLEDDSELGVNDLKKHNFNSKDCLIGITAGGTTPYVLGGLDYAKTINALAIAISCVPNSQAIIPSDIDIRLVTGPEILTGSTRLKAGTATKMALNIISTSVMVKLGKVFKNQMVDVSASNNKLFDRSVRILHDLLGLNRKEASSLINECGGSVKLSLLVSISKLPVNKAKMLLDSKDSNLRLALSSLDLNI